MIETVQEIVDIWYFIVEHDINRIKTQRRANNLRCKEVCVIITRKYR